MEDVVVAVSQDARELTGLLVDAKTVEQVYPWQFHRLAQ